MEAIFLKRPDGTETDISICGKCGSPARGRTNFDVSERCCTCWECSGELTTEERQCGHYHKACDKKRRAIIEMKRLEKATLVEDYDGPVYCEGVPGGSYGDGYFADVQELADMLDDGDVDESIVREEFAYCCTSSPVAGLDVDSILESATEESFEDAIDHLVGVDELRAAVEAFNEANKAVLSWDSDYSRKVRIPAVRPHCGECDGTGLVIGPFGESQVPCPRC